jgi:hypothetical protein
VTRSKFVFRPLDHVVSTSTCKPTTQTPEKIGLFPRLVTGIPLGRRRVFLLALTCGLASGIDASAQSSAISFIQVNSATPQTPTATVTVSYKGAQTPGDLNVVVVGWNDTKATVQSVKDSAGNTYSLAIGPTSGTALRQSIYYAPNIAGISSNAVTVAFSQAATSPDVRILEYRGVNTLDVTAGASGNSTSANSGAVTTKSANELIFGANTVATTTTSPGSGFATRVITTPDGDIAEDKILTAAGSNSATATLNSAGPWVMQMVTFATGAAAASPTVTGVSPSSGPVAGGTAVTITGTNFVTGATVTFGSATATNVSVVNSTTITATTPAGTAGAATVKVTNSSGQSGSLASAFTYAASPTVAGVSPGNGPVAGGTAVTITGTNFVTGATVMFGSAAATNVSVVNSTTITATTPAGTAGAATVKVNSSSGQSGSLASGFTYVVGQPTVSSVSPNNGPAAGGTAVTIAGTNFAAGAGVAFGGTAATNVVVVNSTTITATTPTGSAGTATVTVTNSGGQSGSLASGFTYNAPGTISFIQVNSATPQTASSTVSVSYKGAQTSGNLNIVVVGWNDTTSTVQSVKDSAGNTYSLAIGPTSGTALRQSIYYAANIVGGSGNTVTVTYSQPAASADVRILEYQGVNTLDVTAGASGNSTSANSGAATTRSPNELIFGANTVATVNAAAGSGFTSRIITSPDSDIAEDRIVTAAGSNSAAATLTSAGPWVMQMVTFATGVAATTPQLSASASSLSFGSMTVNSSATLSLTLTSSGTAPVTVNSASVSGTGFSLVGGTLPATLSPNQTMTLQVKFAPTATGSATGSLTISSNSASGSTKTVSLNGTGATATTPQLSFSAASLSFGNVTVNSSGTQSLTLTSSGTAAVTVNSASVSGTGFTLVAASLPTTLNPNQSLTLQVQFTPHATGSASGSLTISSNSTSGSSASVALSGTGTAANPQLTFSATSLSFGSVNVKSTATQSLTLTSSGTTPVTVNSASVSGTGFSLVGGSFPLTLNPQQTATLQVQFLPTAAGAVTGQLTISSNSTSGSSASVALSGTGIAVAHSVSLSWSAPTSSTDPVVGYNIYRSLSGGSLQMLNATPITGTTYVDNSVVSGSTYAYTVESVDANGVQSAPSNQTNVTIPTP